MRGYRPRSSRFLEIARCEPFVFPAMGSHGAGTTKGQASVLAHYGIDERTMECPVVSTFDVISLGGLSRYAASKS